MAVAYGLDVHVEQCAKEYSYKLKYASTWKFEISSNTKLNQPIYQFYVLVPAEVHHIAGFVDIMALLRCTLLICKGYISLMTKTTINLTWLEDWVAYLELMYGISYIRCI